MWIQLRRLWEDLHKRRYEQSRIMQSLKPAQRDLRRWALNIADDARPPVFA